MMPAVSQPAVPPPTMTTAFTGCTTLELGPHSQREIASVVDEVQGLIREPSVAVIDGVRQVRSLEVHAEVAVDVVLRAEVQLGRMREVHRLVAERGAALLLAEIDQLIPLPLQRQPGLEPVRLIEPDEVGRVAESRHRELVRRQTVV